MIQSRYGWTDEIIRNLLFSRFTELVRLLSGVRRAEAKEKLVLAAFVGWQIGAGGKKKFGEYLRHLGLSDEAPQQADSRKGEAATLLQKREDEALSRMGIKAKKVKK